MRKEEKGQILLIVVLTMVVALTVGLSIASRTITNLKLSKQNEESQRAFQAAEAGIEQALQSPSSSISLQQFTNNNSQYTANITSTGGTSVILSGGEALDQDVGADVWLSTYPNYSNPLTANLNVYFSTQDQNTCSKSAGSQVRPGIEIIVLSGTVSNPSVSKSFFDPCASRTTGSSSPGGGATVEGTQFNYSVSVSVSQGLIMKVIPIYNSSVVAVSVSTPGQSLPTQGTVIESTGKSGETVRKVEYFSSYPQIPLEVFPYSLISQ